MKRFTMVLVVLVIIFTMVVASGCGSNKPKNDWERIQQAGKIVVGTSADYPPFEFMDEKGAFQGFDVVLMEEVAKRLGITVEWQNIAFDGLIASLQTSKIDAIIAAMSATDERKQQVDFTQAYFIGADAILVAEGSGIQITKNEDMAAYKIGVQSGTIQETWIGENLPSATVSRYEKADQAIMDLKSGRVEVVAMDYYAALAYLQQGGITLALKTEFSGEHMSIAVRKGSTELQKQLDDTITQLRNEGFVDQLAEQYLANR